MTLGPTARRGVILDARYWRKWRVTNPGRLAGELDVRPEKRNPLRKLGWGEGKSGSNSQNQKVQPNRAKPSQKARSGSARRIAPAVARQSKPRKTVKAALPA